MIEYFRLKIEGMLSIRIKKTERNDTTNRSGGSIINLVPAWPVWGDISYILRIVKYLLPFQEMMLIKITIKK